MADNPQINAILNIASIKGLDSKSLQNYFAANLNGFNRVIAAANSLQKILDSVSAKTGSAYTEAQRLMNAVPNAVAGKRIGSQGTLLDPKAATTLINNLDKTISAVVRAAAKGKVDLNRSVEQIVKSAKLGGKDSGILRDMIWDRIADNLNRAGVTLNQAQQAYQRRIKQGNKEISSLVASGSRLERQQLAEQTKREDATRKKLSGDAKKAEAKRAREDAAAQRQSSALLSAELERASGPVLARSKIEEAVSKKSAADTTAQVIAKQKELKRSFEQTERASQRAAAQFNRDRVTLEKFGDTVGRIGTRFAAFLVASSPIYLTVRALSQAVRGALEFEKVITRIEQVSGKGRGDTNAIRNFILEKATSTGVGAVELASGTEIFAQAGIKDTRELTKITEQLAKVPLAATFGDIRQTSEGLLAVFGQFNKTADDTAYILDLINQYAADFAVESQDIFTGISKGGAAFATAGGSLEEFIQLFSVLRETTRESAETLGTFFKTGTASLLGSRSQSILQELGIGPGSLPEQLTSLSDRFFGPKSNLTSLQRVNISEELVGQRQFNRLLNLLQSLQNPSIQRKLEAAQGSAVGSLDASIGKRADDIGQSLARLRENFNNFFNTLQTNEGVKQFVSTLTDLLSLVLKLAPAVESLAPVLVGLAAGVAVSKLPAIVSGTRGFLSRRSSPESLSRRIEQDIPLSPFANANEIERVRQQREIALEGALKETRSKRNLRDRLINRSNIGLAAGATLIGASIAASNTAFEQGNNQAGSALSGAATGGSIGLGLALINPVLGTFAAVLGASIGAVTGFVNALNEEKRDLLRKELSGLSSTNEQISTIFSRTSGEGFLQKDAFVQTLKENPQILLNLRKEAQKQLNNQPLAFDASDSELKVASESFGFEFSRNTIRNNPIVKKMLAAAEKAGPGVLEVLEKNILEVVSVLEDQISVQASRSRPALEALKKLDRSSTFFYSSTNNTLKNVADILENSGDRIARATEEVINQGLNRTTNLGRGDFSSLTGSDLSGIGISRSQQERLIRNQSSERFLTDTIIQLQRGNVTDSVVQTFGSKFDKNNDVIDDTIKQGLSDFLARTISTSGGNFKGTAIEDLVKIIPLQDLTQLFGELDQASLRLKVDSRQLFEQLLESSNVAEESAKIFGDSNAIIDKIIANRNKLNQLENQHADSLLSLGQRYNQILNETYQSFVKIADIDNKISAITNSGANDSIFNRGLTPFEQNQSSLSNIIKNAQSINTSTIFGPDTYSVSDFLRDVEEDIAGLRELRLSGDPRTKLVEDRIRTNFGFADNELSRQFSEAERATNLWTQALETSQRSIEIFEGKLQGIGQFRLGVGDADFSQRIKELAEIQNLTSNPPSGVLTKDRFTNAFKGKSPTDIQRIIETANSLGLPIGNKILEDFGERGLAEANVETKLGSISRKDLIRDNALRLEEINRLLNKGGLDPAMRKEIARERTARSTPNFDPAENLAEPIRNDLRNQLNDPSLSKTQKEDIRRQINLSGRDLLIEKEIENIRKQRDKLAQDQTNVIELQKKAINTQLEILAQQRDLYTKKAVLDQEDSNRFRTSMETAFKSIQEEMTRAAEAIRKQFSKENGGDIATTVKHEIAPVQVNVAVSAHDILGVIAPVVYKQIMVDIGPAIANALGIVSPEAQSSFNSSLRLRE